MKVGELLTLLNTLYPFAEAEVWDNSGLQTGDEQAEIQKILLCLDVTPFVLQYAVQNGFNVVLAHHPVLFRAVKTLRESDGASAMLRFAIRENLHLIAMHTNLDKHPLGTGYALCQVLGLENAVQDGFSWIAESKEGFTLEAFGQIAEEKLHTPVRIYGDLDRCIRRICLIPGSGMDEWELAKVNHCDLLLTGDVKHHNVLDALFAGICVLDAGHVGTEIPVLDQVLATLQKQKSMIESGIIVEVCAQNPYAHFKAKPDKGRGD